MPRPPAHWVVPAARAAFVIALAVTLVMALLPHPPALPIDALGDKFEHSLAFATLAFLASAGFPRAELLRIGERLSFLGALIEVMQAMPAIHRDCDILDWLTDTAAVAAVLVMVALVRHRQQRRAAGHRSGRAHR